MAKQQAITTRRSGANHKEADYRFFRLWNVRYETHGMPTDRKTGEFQMLSRNVVITPALLEEVTELMRLKTKHLPESQRLDFEEEGPRIVSLQLVSTSALEMLVTASDAQSCPCAVAA